MPPPPSAACSAGGALLSDAKLKVGREESAGGVEAVARHDGVDPADLEAAIVQLLGASQSEL